MEDITKVFRSHFKLNEDFDVVFQHRVGVKKSDLITKHNQNDGKRNSVLKKVVNQVGIEMDEEMIVDDVTLTHALHNYFKNKHIEEEHEQLNYVINAVRRDVKFIDNDDSFCEREAMIMSDDRDNSVGLDDD